MKTDIHNYSDFLNSVRNDRLVYLFGTGISSALTGKRYGWRKWIEDGIYGLKNSSEAAVIEDELKADDSTETMIKVVGRVINAAKEDGTYDAWMQTSFETNTIQNPRLAATLKKLTIANDIFATTNYDLLLEQATGLRALSYEQPGEVFTMLECKRSDAVLHIHGIYDSHNDVDSIIGSEEQYEKVINDQGAQFIQNILGTRTLVFVGCGKTTEDANIARFVAFARTHLKLDRTYYFLYNASSPVVGLPANIKLIPYGDQYADLSDFLEDIAQERLRAKIEASRLIGRTVYTETSTDLYGLAEYHYANEYLKFCGRKRELGQLYTFLELDTRFLWWAITGQAGAGKSRLAYECMKKTPFGFFSFFVNLSAGLEQARQFIPFSDTLIIVDYVLGNESHIADIVNALHDVFSQPENVCYKLRILFLERDSLTVSGTWFYNLERSFQYGDRVRFRNAEYRANPSAQLHDFLYIDDLDYDAVLELIGDVCEKHALPTDSYRDRMLRDTYEQKYEQLRFRPLFLQIYVQAWIENGQTNIDYHGYRGLLNAVLEKEQEHLLNAVNQDRQCLTALLQLMIRASVSPLLSNKLSQQYLPHWELVSKWIKDNSLPGIERRERTSSLYRDAAQVTGDTDGIMVIQPQYPDIIKEALFLHYIDDLNDFGNELWENVPDAFSQFLYRCIVDFPDATELFDYLRKVTEDGTNIPAMRARIAILRHEIITREDDPFDLNQLIDTEFAYWQAVDQYNPETQDVRIEGLYAALKQYLGWSREKDAFRAVEELSRAKGAEEIQNKKCQFLLDAVTYLRQKHGYQASEKVRAYLDKILAERGNTDTQLRALRLKQQSEHLLNEIGSIRPISVGVYEDRDWEAAWELCDRLENSCDLSVEEDAEIFTYTLAESIKMCVEKLAGGRICDYFFRLQDYAEQYGRDQSVAFNDRIHYNYLRGKYYNTEAVSVLSTLASGDSRYAAQMSNALVKEISSNIMIRDFAGLLVGAWALKVGYDESVTDAMALGYRQKAEALLEEYPDNVFLCAKYMDLIWAIAREQQKRAVTKAEIEKCYPLVLRFPDDEDVLDEFFKLLKDSTERRNWQDYVQNKPVLNGLIQHRRLDYLTELLEESTPQEPYVRTHKKIGANDLCPCGSGKKYKKCCRGKGIYD